MGVRGTICLWVWPTWWSRSSKKSTQKLMWDKLFRAGIKLHFIDWLLGIAQWVEYKACLLQCALKQGQCLWTLFEIIWLTTLYLLKHIQFDLSYLKSISDNSKISEAGSTYVWAKANSKISSCCWMQTNPDRKVTILVINCTDL